eukprot:2460465-Pleurochrysis_carterae.AAC.1
MSAYFLAHYVRVLPCSLCPRTSWLTRTQSQDADIVCLQEVKLRELGGPERRVRAAPLSLANIR